jgi:hypothetical protein
MNALSAWGLGHLKRTVGGTVAMKSKPQMTALCHGGD